MIMALNIYIALNLYVAFVLCVLTYFSGAPVLMKGKNIFVKLLTLIFSPAIIIYYIIAAICAAIVFIYFVIIFNN